MAFRSFIVPLLGALSFAGSAQAEGGPGAIDAFRKAQDDIIVAYDGGATGAGLQAKVDALLDYDWIAKAALGKAACEDRCDAKLARNNFLKRLKAMDRDKVQYLTEHVGKDSTTVDTKVEFPQGDGALKVVEIDYVMHKVDGAWVVRDILSDDVSVVASYEKKIGTLYQAGGIDAVITVLGKMTGTKPAP